MRRWLAAQEPPTEKVKATLWAVGIGLLMEHALVALLARSRADAVKAHAVGLPFVMWLGLHFGYEARDA